MIGRPSVALAIVALIGAGCGSQPAENAGGSSRHATQRSKAMKFAACMRKNGVREFPDPNAAGELTIDAIANRSSLDTDGAAFKQALGACRDLQPPGFTGRKRSDRQQEQALAFARCIRDNGVKDFPDPAKGEPLVDTRKIPSTAQPGGMTILKAAMQKCGDAVAGLVSRP